MVDISFNFTPEKVVNCIINSRLYFYCIGFFCKIVLFVYGLLFLTDNDEDDLMLLHEALLSFKQPFEIVEIFSGEELMEKLSKMTERFPDFIFLDIAMPGIDGFKCLELIKNRIKAPSLIKIIIYSGDSSELSIQKGFSLGADFYAVKPNRYEDLKNLVELVIENDWKSSDTTDKVFHV